MSHSNEKSNNRRVDLDWLRVAAVLLLIPFHASLIFVLDPNSIMYVKDTLNSTFLVCMAGYIHQFHMPLLFAIAGASSYFALNLRSGGKYLLERVKRLLVPGIFTTLVLVPPMTYIARISNGEKITFTKHFLGFSHLNPNDLTGLSGTLTPAHAWFILFLALFSALALPLFLQERKYRSGRFADNLASFFTKPFALYLLLIPFAAAAAIELLGDKNPVYYFGTFLLGYLLMTDKRYQQAVDREAPVSFILGTAFFIIRLLWHPGFSEWSPAWVGYGLMEQGTRLFLLYGILGLGHRFIHNGGKVLDYLSKAAFPFYLLHLLITTLVGFLVIQLHVGITIKYLMIITSATLATFGVYEFLKRFSISRFLLGIK